MSTLFVNNLNTASGSTITVPTGKQIIGTDTNSIKAPGMVIQSVHSDTSTWTPRVTTNSTSYTSTNHTLTITPKYSNSILLHSYFVSTHNNSAGHYVYIVLNKSGVGNLMDTESANGGKQAWSSQGITNIKDIAGTTNAITYTMHLKAGTSGTAYLGWTSSFSNQNSCSWSIIEIAQ
jgi:hypothetical protein